MRIGLLIAAMTVAYTIPAASEPTRVRLPDYAFDFPTHGYEITVAGRAHAPYGALTAEGYLDVHDGGYRMKTVIDRMSRQDRQQFIGFFNANCVGSPYGRCKITASGDIELNKEMQMVFRPTTAAVSLGDKAWSNAGGE